MPVKTASTATESLPLSIALVLVREPGRSARELARALGVTRTSVNQILYRYPSLFRSGGERPPRWSVILPAVSPPVAEMAPSTWEEEGDYALDLWDWQAEAMQAWEDNGRLGIVEAVTGSGKTRLGLVAVAQAVEEGSRAAVVVPTIELLHQWKRELDGLLGVRVGLMGDGNDDSLGSFQILVATAASARTKYLGLPSGVSGLLVADEVHRFASSSNRFGLEDAFDQRLGLSATYERQDGLHEEVLLPYFDEVVYTLRYPRAKRDGVIAEVRMAMIGVDLLPGERVEYTKLSDVVSKMTGRLVNEFGAPREPYSAFMAAVNRMAESGTIREGIAAKRYLKAVGDRRRLLAETPNKLSALRLLEDAIELADRTIVFTTTTNSADAVAEDLDDIGFAVASHHSKVERNERKRRLDAFASGDLGILTTAQTLNEGVDVPSADLGIIFGGSRQRREMVQRLGRILRLKEDDRHARFVVLYVTGSVEDPKTGFQDEFIQEMMEITNDVAYFNMDSDPDDVTAFLAP